MPVLRKNMANRKNKVSLPTLLTGLVTMSVLLTLTLLLFASYQSKKQSLIDTTLTLNSSSARNMSLTIDSLFASMRESLKYSAGVFSKHQSMNAKEILLELELMRHSSNYFNSVVLVDEKGTIRSVSPAAIGSAGMSITTAAAKQALASRKSYISQPYVTTRTQRLIVFMSEPIFDKDGVYKGLIGGTIYLQQNNILSMIFGHNSKDDIGGYFYIVSSNGHVLYHPDKERIGVDISANSVVRKLIKGQSGEERQFNLLGQEMLAGYAEVPTNHWGVVAVSPMSVVYEQLNRHIKSLLWFILTPIALLMLIVIWLARKLAKPFVSLANAVSRMGGEKAEELPVLKQHWNREADLLAKTIAVTWKAVQKQTDQLTSEAMTDPLTGLMNRRTFELIVNEWIGDRTLFSILIIDVDHFKAINDTYGHLAGDEVLRRLARTVSSSVRPADVCCRYGGEEFVVLLRDARSSKAYQIAERIRLQTEGEDHLTEEPLTVSIGVAEFPAQAESADKLFELADKALYQAKETGRNRTVLA